MACRMWLTTSAVTAALGAVLPPQQLAANTDVAIGALTGSNSPVPGTTAVGILVTLVGAAAWACAAWLVVLCLFDLATVLPGRLGDAATRCRAALTPRLLAGLLSSGLAASSAIGVATPAFAESAAITPRSAAAGTIAAGTIAATAPPCSDPLPNLDRPGIARPALCPLTTHTVRPGDTLWAIAAAELTAVQRAAPSAAAIAARWPVWWQANRAAIGDDPALLLPGEHLAAPPVR